MRIFVIIFGVVILEEVTNCRQIDSPYYEDDNHHSEKNEHRGVEDDTVHEPHGGGDLDNVVAYEGEESSP